MITVPGGLVRFLVLASSFLITLFLLPRVNLSALYPSTCTVLDIYSRPRTLLYSSHMQFIPLACRCRWLDLMGQGNNNYIHVLLEADTELSWY